MKLEEIVLKGNKILGGEVKGSGWEIPGGIIDSNLTPEELGSVAIKHVADQTGAKIKLLQLLTYKNKLLDNNTHMILAKALTPPTVKGQEFKAIKDILNTPEAKKRIAFLKELGYDYRDIL